MYLIRLGDRVNSFYINGKMSRSHPHIEWMVAVTRSGNDSMVKMVRMEDGKITHQVLDSTKTVWRKNGQTRPGGGVWNRSPKTDVNREYTNEKRRDHSDQARRDRTKAARAALAEKRRNKKMELPDSVKPFIDLEKPKKASKQKRRGPYKPRDIQITNTEMMDRMRSTEQRLSMDIIKARHDLQSYSDLQASKMNMKILGAMVVCVFGVVIYHAVSELISLM